MQRKPSKRYWRAFEALVGDVTPEQLELAAAPRRQASVSEAEPNEDWEQIKAATWLDKNHILFFHVPNGGRRHKLEGIKFKRMGVKAGVPDIVIPIPTKSHHGLYIELKRSSGGVLSEAQRYWLAELKNRGYDTFVAKGADELIKYVKNYLGV